MKKAISIIIPARDEENNIKRIIPLLFQNYPGFILELIVVNDGSKDKTANAVEYLKKTYTNIRLINRRDPHGVGLALREGISNVSPNAKYILTMDCDFIDNVPDIKTFIEKIDQYDGLVGSRFMKPKSLTNYPFPKYIANRSYHLLAQILFRIPHHDLTNNLKLYKKTLIDKIYPLLTRPDFAINAELGFYPLLHGARIGEIPVAWHERDKGMGFSKFKIFRVGPSYCLVLLRLVVMRIRNIMNKKKQLRITPKIPYK